MIAVSRAKITACLKKCMFSEDRKAHRKHERTAAGRRWLEKKAHTDQLLGLCTRRCLKG